LTACAPKTSKIDQRIFRADHRAISLVVATFLLHTGGG